MLKYAATGLSSPLPDQIGAFPGQREGKSLSLSLHPPSLNLYADTRLLPVGVNCFRQNNCARASTIEHILSNTKCEREQLYRTYKLQSFSKGQIWHTTFSTVSNDSTCTKLQWLLGVGRYGFVTAWEVILEHSYRSTW